MYETSLLYVLLLEVFFLIIEPSADGFFVKLDEVEFRDIVESFISEHRSEFKKFLGVVT